MKHTPGPWRIDEEATNQIVTDTGYRSNNEILIATVEHCDYENDGEDDIGFIVTACNNHDRLVKVLGIVTRAFEAHLKDGAKRENVSPDVLCPCWDTELKMAKECLNEVQL